ncbi:glycosyltransferase [Dongia sp.]|uniref:glycosyltransferase n=1 Tax=Dongia sp. TaxID=1977262 RepID=UPI0035AD8646
MASSKDERLPLSVIVPCYHEEDALPEFFRQLAAWQNSSEIGRNAEIILVDDGSRDGTWRVIQSFSALDERVRGVRLLVNRGSHIALRCGYRHAQGNLIVNVPVDLQEPLEQIDLLLAEMTSKQADITLAIRHSRDDKLTDRIFSALYHRLLRLLGLKNLPVGGSSQFLFSRRVIDLLNSYPDHSVTIDGFIANSPFPTATITYHRRAAVRTTRWSFMRKISHALDSIVAFSELPIRLMGAAGLIIAAAGFLFAIFTVYRAITGGGTPEGWASIICAVTLIGGLNLMALSVIGEYLWRTLNEARRRPLYAVAEVCGFKSPETGNAQ